MKNEENVSWQEPVQVSVHVDSTGQHTSTFRWLESESFELPVYVYRLLSI